MPETEAKLFLKWNRTKRSLCTQYNWIDPFSPLDFIEKSLKPVEFKQILLESFPFLPQSLCVTIDCLGLALTMACQGCVR